jgi:hypothetical protein
MTAARKRAASAAAPRAGSSAAGALAVGLLAAGLLAAGAARADKIKNPTAVFSGLDKITGRIISFEVAVDETVQFGALQLTARVCYTRPPTESPSTTSFIEVDEVTLDSKYRRIFTGWMFAASPGLHAIEHPVYDVWLTDCKGGGEVIAEAKETLDEPAPPTARDGRERRRAGEGRPPPAVAAEAPAAAAPAGARLDVSPPRGVPVRPPQEPSRRFFPTNAPPLNDPGR